MPTTAGTPTLDGAGIAPLLATARGTIDKVRHAWLATCAVAGGANARAVRVYPGATGGDEWTRRLLVRRDSRKVGEIGRDPRVTLAYQDTGADAYVALGGLARLVHDHAEMRSLWPADADALFSKGFADATLIVVRVEVDRIEIHARGVTREPFGYGRTLIEREATGGWRFVPD